MFKNKKNRLGKAILKKLIDQDLKLKDVLAEIGISSSSFSSQSKEDGKMKPETIEEFRSYFKCKLFDEEVKNILLEENDTLNLTGLNFEKRKILSTIRDKLRLGIDVPEIKNLSFLNKK